MANPSTSLTGKVIHIGSWFFTSLSESSWAKPKGVYRPHVIILSVQASWLGWPCRLCTPHKDILGRVPLTLGFARVTSRPTANDQLWNQVTPLLLLLHQISGCGWKHHRYLGTDLQETHTSIFLLGEETVLLLGHQAAAEPSHNTRKTKSSHVLTRKSQFKLSSGEGTQNPAVFLTLHWHLKQAGVEDISSLVSSWLGWCLITALKNVSTGRAE